MTDWSKLKSENKTQYKDWAKAGRYTVKLSEVEIKEVGKNGSIIQKFKFEESDDYKFPSADHWLTFKNDKFRLWHQRCLFITLGLSEELAEKTVDACEKDDKDKTVKAYAEAFKKLAAKNPEVEIEVWYDGQYNVADFTDGKVRMNRPKTEKEVAEDILSSAETIDDSEFPF